MKLQNRSDNVCVIGFSKPDNWYDWVGYRLYENFRRVNNKPVKFENHFYTSDNDMYIGFELDERDIRFWI